MLPIHKHNQPHGMRLLIFWVTTFHPFIVIALMPIHMAYGSSSFGSLQSNPLISTHVLMCGTYTYDWGMALIPLKGNHFLLLYLHVFSQMMWNFMDCTLSSHAAHPHGLSLLAFWSLQLGKKC